MFYLIFFGILWILARMNLQRHDSKSKVVFSCISGAILVGIAGLRYETGGDWDTYALIFADIPPLSRLFASPAELFHQPVEEGFTLLCALVKTCGGTLQGLFFIVTAINISLIAIASNKYTKYPAVALLGYYAILYFQLEMIYIRQATAVALCYFALQYIPSRKLWKYLLLILLACLFHRVAALMLPLYFALDRKLPTWLYLTVVGLGALLMLTGIPWMRTIMLTAGQWLGETYAEKIRIYTENALFAVTRQFSIGFFLNLAIFVAILFFRKKIEGLPYGTIMINMFALSLVCYYYCFELVEVSNRGRMLFLISLVVLLPMILEVLPLFIERLAGLLLIALYCFSFSRNIFLEAPKAAAYNPYQNYIEFKIHPRPSTGKARLEQSKQAFNQERTQ